MTLRSTALVLLLALVPSNRAQARTPAVPILPPDSVRAGEKAVVLTVFQGQTIEPFDAEIVGVLRGGRAEGDMILARATSERVQRTGIAQGMSGSPVYVRGRLIGALSSGWQFSREPIFGITPITEMLPLLDLPVPATSDPSAGPTGSETAGLASGVRFGAFRWAGDDDADAGGTATRALAPQGASAGLEPLALPLASAGLHPAALEFARVALAPLRLMVVPGGRASNGGPAADALQPGAAVSVDVMRGDLQMSAIGTVTYRDGDRILIFGHPLFQSGDVRMPLSTAEIATIIPSEISSFKLGVRGREAGVATQDRRSAVAGHLGGAPHMLPFSVSITDGTPASSTQRFHFETLEDRALAPSLVPVAVLNSLLESGGTGAGQTLRWHMKLVRPGHAPLVLEDLATGESASSELMNGLGSPLRFLFNNPFQRLVLDSIAVDLVSEPRRKQWTLRSARLIEAAVRPGASLTVRCEIEPWRGGREKRDLTLTVPEEAPPGRYQLWVGGGNELMRFEAQRLPGRYRPTSLDEAWQRLAGLRSSDAIYATITARAPELTSEGRDYPELPLSALLVLASGGAAGERSRTGDTAFLDQTRLPINGVLRGELVLEVTVDPKAP